MWLMVGSSTGFLAVGVLVYASWSMPCVIQAWLLAAVTVAVGGTPAGTVIGTLKSFSFCRLPSPPSPPPAKKIKEVLAKCAED